MRNIISSCKTFLLQQIIPGIYACSSNKKVTEIESKQEEFEVDLTNINDDDVENYIEQVENDLDAQRDRKKSIEDKAKSLLSIIAVSITAITFSLNYLNSIIFSGYQIVAVCILFISIIYFIMGAIRALQTLNIRKFYIIQANVEIGTDKFKLHKNPEPKNLLENLIKKKQLNDLINVRLSNYAYASFNLIRNGIVMFVVFFISTICANYFAKKNIVQDAYKVNKEIQVKINDSINLKIPYQFDLTYGVRNLEIIKNVDNIESSVK